VEFFFVVWLKLIPMAQVRAGAAAGCCGLGGAVWQDAEAVGLRAHRPVLSLEIVALRLDAVICDLKEAGERVQLVRKHERHCLADGRSAEWLLLQVYPHSPVQSCSLPLACCKGKPTRRVLPSAPLTNRVWVAKDVAKLQRVGGMAGRVSGCTVGCRCSPICTSQPMLLIGLQHSPACCQLCSAMYACLSYESNQYAHLVGVRRPKAVSQLCKAGSGNANRVGVRVAAGCMQGSAPWPHALPTDQTPAFRAAAAAVPHRVQN